MHENYFKIALGYENLKDYKNAKKFYKKSIKNRPSEKAYERLGIIESKENIKSSKKYFESALKINPNNKVSLYNIGVAERLEGNYSEAMEVYLKLLNLGVDNENLYLAIAILKLENGEINEAKKFYELAINKNSKSDLVKFNYSLYLLSIGDFKNGLSFYESRKWNEKPPGKEWKGEKDCNVLIVPEQGNGDMIQFSRYFSKLKSHCNKITVLCNHNLIEIFRKINGIDEVLEFNPGDVFLESNEKNNENISFEKFIRIMSVPYVLNIDPSKEKFERYIFPCSKKIKKWSNKIKSKKLKVGLCWQGGKRKELEFSLIDKKRSIKLEKMKPILEMKGIDFFSLQKDDDQHNNFHQITNFMNESENFEDTAAIIENLDLVVSVDTAVAHLAASIGKPTWMLARKGGCWRWGVEGDSTFWYPSMKIFRQEKVYEWDSTISKIKEELFKLLNSYSS